MGWENRLTKEKAQRLYDKHGSAKGVGKALGVASSTAHVWLKAAGVKLRPQGSEPGRRREKPKAARAPKVVVEEVVRTLCIERRTWRNKVISCVMIGEGSCAVCTRGEDLARLEVSLRSKGGEILELMRRCRAGQRPHDD